MTREDAPEGSTSDGAARPDRAPDHSITRSARRSTAGGKLMPCAFAVRRSVQDDQTSHPPSTAIDWPVMFFASSDARKHTVSAMSWADVTRRSAISWTYSS
jgi:hypothetical protein